MKKRLDIEIGPFQFIAHYDGLNMAELVLKKAKKGVLLSPQEANDLSDLLAEYTGRAVGQTSQKPKPVAVGDEKGPVIKELANGSRVIDGVVVEKRTGDLPKFYH